MNEYFELLKQWCDALIALQVVEIQTPGIYGGILCPSCARIHGRCGDAVYPLMYMADVTGDEKYLNAAKRLFDFSEHMTRPDGSYINDTNSDWRGITVFAVISLGEALHYHGHLLDAQTRHRWTKRLETAAEFLYEFIDHANGNINYPITCAASMAVASRVVYKEKFCVKARHLAHDAIRQITPEGLIFGEGTPNNAITPKGCRPVDIGYNVEESLGGLITYGLIMQDAEVLAAAQKSMLAHAQFMLPDGGWDDSFGSRSNKWTYWGSRTSDGCQIAYGLMADKNPLFAEIAHRNFELLRACTANGLLHGGPMYTSAKEPPCSHHTFCHAKALAAMLEHGFQKADKLPLPRECAQGMTEFASIHTALIAKGKFKATLTDYDFDNITEGHATGGAMTLLWHEQIGTLIAATMTKYQLVEPNNMQIPQRYDNICLTPRIEQRTNGVYYRNINDKSAVMECSNDRVTARGKLKNGEMAGETEFLMEYFFGENEVVFTAIAEENGCIFLLPVISGSGDTVEIKTSGDGYIAAVQSKKGIIYLESKQEIAALERAFNPVGGFEAIPFYIKLAKGEQSKIKLSVK